MKYTILSAANPGSLADSVNGKLAIGWELYGSPCTTENWISQAMILNGLTEEQMREERMTGGTPG